MIWEHLMGWLTLLAGLATLLTIAGPYKHYPLSMRWLLWFLALSLLGIANYWLARTFDKAHSYQAMVLTYFILLIARVGILALVPYIFYQWCRGSDKFLREQSCFSPDVTISV